MDGLHYHYHYMCMYVGGRPQGHHHVNGDALAGHGLCHLPIRPNPMLTWYIHRANYPEDNLVRFAVGGISRSILISFELGGSRLFSPSSRLEVDEAFGPSP